MLDWPAVAIHFLPERAPHALKIPNIAFENVEASAGHPIGIGARSLGVMFECEEVTHFIDGEAEFTSVPDECQTLNERVVILAIPIAVTSSGGQKRHLLIVADHFDIDAGESAQRSYGVGDGHDWTL